MMNGIVVLKSISTCCVELSREVHASAHCPCVRSSAVVYQMSFSELGFASYDRPIPFKRCDSPACARAFREMEDVIPGISQK